MHPFKNTHTHTHTHTHTRTLKISHTPNHTCVCSVLERSRLNSDRHAGCDGTVRTRLVFPLVRVSVLGGRGEGGASPSHLAEEDGHEVVVEQEGLGEVGVVEVEEERGETQRDVLQGRGAERRAHQLHPRDGDEESPATGGRDGDTHRDRDITQSTRDGT